MKGNRFVRPITKIFYSFGVVFLLAGMLVSALNIPVSAQVDPVSLQEGGEPEEPPEGGEEFGPEDIIDIPPGLEPPSEIPDQNADPNPEPGVLDSVQATYDLEFTLDAYISDCEPVFVVDIPLQYFPHLLHNVLIVNASVVEGTEYIEGSTTYEYYVDHPLLNTPDKRVLPFSVNETWKNACTEAAIKVKVVIKAYHYEWSWSLWEWYLKFDQKEVHRETIQKPQDCCPLDAIEFTNEPACPTLVGEPGTDGNLNNWKVTNTGEAEASFTWHSDNDPTGGTVTLGVGGIAEISTPRTASGGENFFVSYMDEYGVTIDLPTISAWMDNELEEKGCIEKAPQLTVTLELYMDGCEPYLTYTVENADSLYSTTATNVILSFEVLQGMGYLDYVPGPVDLGDMAPGVSVTNTMVLPANQSYFNAPGGVVIEIKGTATGDNASANSTDDVEKPAECAPDLEILLEAKLVDCEPVYILTVTNSGPGSLKNITINFDITEGNQFVEGGNPSSIDIMFMGSNLSVEYTIEVDTNDQWKYFSSAGDKITLKATAATADGFFSDSDTDSAEQSEECEAAPQIDVEITQAVCNAESNCEPVFTVTVTNVGEIPLKNVNVEHQIIDGGSYVADPIANEWIGDLDVGKPITYTVTPVMDASWASAPVGASVTLQATAYGAKITEADLNGTACAPSIMDTDEATAVKPAECMPAELVMSVVMKDQCDPELIIKVTNNGAIDANGVQITLELLKDTGGYVTSSFPQVVTVDIPAGGVPKDISDEFDLTVNLAGWQHEHADGAVIRVKATFTYVPEGVNIGRDQDYKASKTNPGYCGAPPIVSVTTKLEGSLCTPSLKVTVSNTGESTARDVNLSFTEDGGVFTQSPAFSPETQSVGDLGPGGSQTFTILIKTTEDWATATAGDLFTVQAHAGYNFANAPYVVDSEELDVVNPGGCNYVPSPDLKLSLECPYEIEPQVNMNVWKVTNDGDAPGTFDWSEPTSGQSGTWTLGVGESKTFETLRTTGVEVFTINYERNIFAWPVPGTEPVTRSITAMTDEQAVEQECKLFIPNIELTLTQACPDYDTMENVWLVENIGNMDSEFNWAALLLDGTGEGSEGTAVPILIGEVVEIRTTRVGDGGDLMTIDYFDEDNVNQIVGPQNSYTDAAAQEMQCLIPETGIGILDPYCEYAGSGNWWNVWTVENLSVYNPLPFSWVLLDESSNPVADGVGNIPVATEQLVYKSEMGTYTLVVTWSDGSETFLTDTKTKEICEYEPPTPPEPPVELPPGPPIPVTAAGGPEVVDAGILIPVTGEDLSEPATFVELMMSILPFAGLLLIGAAMLIQGLTKKQQES